MSKVDARGAARPRLCDVAWDLSAAHQAPQDDPMTSRGLSAKRPSQHAGTACAAHVHSTVRVVLDGTAIAAQLQPSARNNAQNSRPGTTMPKQLSLPVAQVYPQLQDRFFYALEIAQQDALLGACIGGMLGWLMVGREAAFAYGLYGALCYGGITCMRTMAGGQGILLLRQEAEPKH